MVKRFIMVALALLTIGVQAFAQNVVTGRVNRIRSGETAPLPLQDGLQSPCSWCDHADACLYDSTLPGCKIQELDHKHRMEMPERKS